MAETISFSLQQLKTGVTPLTSPNEITSASVGGPTGSTNRAYTAIIGDGDKTLETGETGYILSGMNSSSRMVDAATVNTADDPVKITAHGRLNSTSVGSIAVDGNVSMSNTWGIGLDHGAETSGRFLNGGDSLTFTLNPKGGTPQALTGFSFVVDMNGSTAATQVAIDFDGDVVNSGNYGSSQNWANADVALRLSVNGGNTVAVDFATQTVSVNGAARTGPEVDAFFAAYAASPQNVLTIGNFTANGFSARDLKLVREDSAGPSENLPPTLALANAVTDLPGNIATTSAVKIADIQISDDGVGKNTLLLAGADAELFQITGNALFLKAGAKLDVVANPSLDVTVRVDDLTIGSGPEASAALQVAVTPNSDNKISFALVQLKSGVTPLTSPSEIGSTSLGTTTSTTNRAFVAIVGDGDKTLEGGETAHILSGVNSSVRMINAATLNTGSDPVTITAHGRLNSTSMGSINPDGDLQLNSTWGIGLDHGAETTGRFLNGGDSVTFTLNPMGGTPQALAAFSFVVDMNGSTAATQVAIDFDGDVVNTGNYASSQNWANADVALRLSVNGGNTVAVDFAAQTVSVNGAARTGPEIDAFFAAYAASPQNVLTIGNFTSSGFSARDLVIERTAQQTVNQPPSVALSGVVDQLAENTNTTQRIEVADIVVTDDGVGSNAVALTGADAAKFEVEGGKLYLKAGVVLDFETQQALAVTVTVDDPSLGSGPEDSVTYTLAVSDVNEAPTLALGNKLATIADNATLSQPLRVADIVVTDDALGSNELSLDGADAALFEISGNGLFLKAGANLDGIANPSLDVTVVVDDPALGTGPEAQQALSIAVSHVPPQVGQITLDGSLSDWTTESRLDTAGTGVSGFALYGTYQADSFVLALSTDGTAIGPNSTFWLNTDLDRSTGYQVFGSAVGAEYNINIAADGTAALYTGGQFGVGDPLTLVTANLSYAFNADRTVLEIALPSDLMEGAPRNAEVFADVNDAVFLPNDYANYSYQVGEEAPLLHKAADTRVAIVYSETSANAYFDKTAYGQLFMSAQNQAMQAGIPFDVIYDTDLKDIANLVKYDALVLPGLSHVKAADLPAISTALTAAVKDYGIGIVSMGNVLTNDETGAAFSGDSYARMKSILGVTLDGFGSTDGVTLKAVSGAHPVSDLFAANETVGSYTNNSYLTFRDVSGNGTTIFTQTVDGPTTDPETLAAVIANTNGTGRNVHFATDAAFGNNNILSEAINWVARGDAPDVGLQMTRGSSLFFSRNDMDQSQETFDVIFTEPNIYDAMLAIVETWYEDFGFVGSYYVNIGAEPPDQRTDWTISKPYYDQLLAMGSEIATHSYTHPDNTNLLLPDTFTEAQRQAWLTSLPNGSLKNQLSDLTLAQTQAVMTAALALTDPQGDNPVDPSTLDALDREILKASYRFQFEYSLLVLERELGITIDGAAVPGAPEKLGVSQEIIQYLDYLTGGYASIGAGYPGAFGFLTPDDAERVYFAPNVSFDFSLIGFRNLTIAQAEAVWAEEYAALINKGTAPIIHFPWHDYGPTNWPDGSGTDPGYNLEMFTTFIGRAAADGTEFVTGADLADRIESFAASKIEISTDGNAVVAKVTGSDLGTFALDVDSSQTIASVDNWYAYDEDQVFLPSNGGTFRINLGSQAADVTHITKLPMRADLLSVSGDGTELSFQLRGEGMVTVDLKAWGESSVVASGADGGSLLGEELSLRFDAIATHTVAIDYTGSNTVVGTSGDDVIIGSSLGTRIDGGQGYDVIIGNAGADTFVFGQSSGNDTVLDFTSGSDVVELVNSGFASASAALAAFVETTEGLALQLSESSRLLLANVSLGEFDADDLTLTNDGLLV